MAVVYEQFHGKCMHKQYVPGPLLSLRGLALGILYFYQNVQQVKTLHYELVVS